MTSIDKDELTKIKETIRLEVRRARARANDEILNKKPRQIRYYQWVALNNLWYKLFVEDYE